MPIDSHTHTIRAISPHPTPARPTPRRQRSPSAPLPQVDGTVSTRSSSAESTGSHSGTPVSTPDDETRRRCSPLRRFLKVRTPPPPASADVNAGRHRHRSPLPEANAERAFTLWRRAEPLDEAPPLSQWAMGRRTAAISAKPPRSGVPGARLRKGGGGTLQVHTAVRAVPLRPALLLEQSRPRTAASTGCRIIRVCCDHRGQLLVAKAGLCSGLDLSNWTGSDNGCADS